MAKRLLLGVLSLGLVLAPSLAQSVPTTTTPSKKQKSAVKSNVSKGKSSHKAKGTLRQANQKNRKAVSSPRRTASRAAVRDDDFDPTNAGAITLPRSNAPVADNKPLMRVIPQRDGKFMLEPLTPKKDLHPLIRPSSRLNQPSPSEAAASQGHFKFEPWNFQELILSRAKTYTGARYRRGLLWPPARPRTAPVLCNTFTRASRSICPAPALSRPRWAR